MEFKQWSKKITKLERAMEDIQEILDKVETPWEAEKFETLYTAIWREYNMIIKQGEN